MFWAPLGVFWEVLVDVEGGVVGVAGAVALEVAGSGLVSRGIVSLRPERSGCVLIVVCACGVVSLRTVLVFDPVVVTVCGWRVPVVVVPAVSVDVPGLVVSSFLVVVVVVVC